MIQQLEVSSSQQGLHEITSLIQNLVKNSNLTEGICHIFLQHTSASLIIQENADPSAKTDLENWMNRLVNEDDPLYTHTFEGPDDMPSHIKSILTQNTLTIPILNRQLALGTWQGIYLWEHRLQPHRRKLLIYTNS